MRFTEQTIDWEPYKFKAEGNKGFKAEIKVKSGVAPIRAAINKIEGASAFEGEKGILVVYAGDEDSRDAVEAALTKLKKVAEEAVLGSFQKEMADVEKAAQKAAAGIALFKSFRVEANDYYNYVTLNPPGMEVVTDFRKEPVPTVWIHTDFFGYKENGTIAVYYTMSDSSGWNQVGQSRPEYIKLKDALEDGIEKVIRQAAAAYPMASQKFALKLKPKSTATTRAKGGNLPSKQGRTAKYLSPLESFRCMECGYAYPSVKAAEKGGRDGCPKCGSVDVDLKESITEITRPEIIKKIPSDLRSLITDLDYSIEEADGGYVLMTANDPQVGIRGEEVSPVFPKLDALFGWVRKNRGKLEKVGGRKKAVGEMVSARLRGVPLNEVVEAAVKGEEPANEAQKKVSDRILNAIGKDLFLSIGFKDRKPSKVFVFVQKGPDGESRAAEAKKLIDAKKIPGWETKISTPDSVLVQLAKGWTYDTL